MTDEKTFKNPTLVGIKCPNCGSENYRIEGTGSAGASVGKQLLFGVAVSETSESENAAVVASCVAGSVAVSVAVAAVVACVDDGA